jgi:hypothetical protein
MRQPKLSDLVIDRRGIKRTHSEATATRGIKVTINIDLATLNTLREMTGTTGVPYQKLLNQILREGLRKHEEVESRLDRIQRELARLKKQVS